MVASDFFLLVMWRFGPSFLKKYHFAPPPTPIGGGLELGISFWHTYTPIVKFLLLLLLLLLVWWTNMQFAPPSRVFPGNLLPSQSDYDP
jgi:hypothetical protein